MQKTNFNDALLKGANLFDAQLDDASFEGAQLAGAMRPDGGMYE